LSLTFILRDGLYNICALQVCDDDDDDDISAYQFNYNY